MPYFPAAAMTLRRRQAQKYILSGLRRKLSGADILRGLQEKTLGYRRQEFYRDVRYWQTARAKAANFKYVGFDKKPTDKLYMQTGWQTKARFESVVSVDIRDRFTGRLETVDVTVVHTHREGGVEVSDRTQNLTRREIESAAKEMVAGYPYAERYDIERADIVVGFYNPDIG